MPSKACVNSVCRPTDSPREVPWFNRCRSTYLDSRFELPLFIHRNAKIIPRSFNNKMKEKSQSFTEFTKEQMATYKIREKCSSALTKDRQHCWPRMYVTPKLCPIKRMMPTDKNVPPNRYTIKGFDTADISLKVTSKLGPYQIFTVRRSDDTVIGNFHEKGSKTFYYDLPSFNDELNYKRNSFKYKFGPPPRDRKADTLPGPNHYYPKNEWPKPKRVPPPPEDPFFFYPISCVPVTEKTYMERQQRFTPNATRYDPVLTSCPCKLDDKILIMRKKLKIYRCPPPNLRNVPGKGHRSVFISKTVHLVKQRENDADVISRPVPTLLDDAFLKRIAHPKRNTISLRREPMPKMNRPKKMRLNATTPYKLLYILKHNRKPPFLSSAIRFEDVQDMYNIHQIEIAKKRDAMGAEYYLEKRRKAAEERKAIEDERREARAKNPNLRLHPKERLNLPSLRIRNLKSKLKGKTAIMHFCELPKPIALIPKDIIGPIDLHDKLISSHISPTDLTKHTLSTLVAKHSASYDDTRSTAAMTSLNIKPSLNE